MNTCIELKVKIKSLAAEAAIIRKEERKLTGVSRWHLQDHRKGIVRGVARQSLIAYQHIRGRDPSVHVPRDPGIWRRDCPEVIRMIKRYGDDDARTRVADFEKRFHNQAA